MVGRVLITLFFVLLTLALLPRESDVSTIQRVVRTSCCIVLFCYLPGYRFVSARFEKDDLSLFETVLMSILISGAYSMVAGLYLHYFEVTVSTGVLVMSSLALIVVCYCVEVIKPSQI